MNTTLGGQADRWRGGGGDGVERVWVGGRGWHRRESLGDNTELNMTEWKSVKTEELGARLQNNVASRTCASFSIGVASCAIAYFSTKKNLRH